MSEKSSTIIRWAKNISIVVGAIVALNVLAGLIFDRDTPLGFLVSYVADSFSSKNFSPPPDVQLSNPYPTQKECDELVELSQGDLVSVDVLDGLRICREILGETVNLPPKEVDDQI